jgi:cytochrome bd-type quinol oxidase subunit 2
MIIHRKGKQPKKDKARLGVIWSSLGIVFVLLVALLGSLALGRRAFPDIDPFFRQYVLMASGLLMLISAALVMQKRKEGEDRGRRVIRYHFISLGSLFLVALVSSIFLKSKGDHQSIALICGCGILLVLAVIFPQSITKLSKVSST